ncbi:hypothetical protein [Niameybacter sp.]|uniref:hypothetical protein n=1 Tax=Niameybacter sp. TaxID=2033640 RepID=UPI002FC8F5F4
MNSEQLNDIIKKINGVLHSKIKEINGQIEEIHIVASKNKSAKQIVRDIESTIFAMFDYEIDRKKISIAQLDMGPMQGIKRVKYEGMSLQVEDKNLECEIRLNHDGEIIKATKRGFKTANNRYRVIADATIQAVEKVLVEDYILSVQDVYVSATKGIDFICIFIHLGTDEKEELLIGSAIIRDDPNEAVVRATLDALNRKLFK